VACIYQTLGLPGLGHVTEMTAVDLTGTKLRETEMQMREAFNRAAAGGILMINGADAWSALPDGGQQMLHCLYRELARSRDGDRDALAVILAGQAGPLRGLMQASPPLAARFPAVIEFPSYTAGQLAAILATLAREAGFTLAPAAAAKAATVLADAEGHHGSGNARLAVRLLDQATASQARRIMTAASPPRDFAVLSTIQAEDIPAHVYLHDQSADDERPGQYL
jgi:AAA lid domain